MKSFALIATAAAIRLQTKQVPTVQEALDECDTSGNGVISKNEFNACMNRTGLNSSQLDLASDLFLDNGKISKTHFMG